MLKDIVGKYAGADTNGGTDKGTLHSYIDTYDNLLAGFVGQGIVMMEVGIATGKSLLMWQEFFENAKIYGIDNSGMYREVLKDHPEIVVFDIDATVKERVEEVVGGLEFDVIIDDASHILEHQIVTAQCLMPKVRSGGLYIIEDVNYDLGLYEVLGKFEVIDLRWVKGRYDDVILVWQR
jgi:hypothetical protein